MAVQFHYEVETQIDPLTNKANIQFFDQEDHLNNRKNAFDYANSVLNILQQNNQLIVDQSNCSARHRAQLNYNIKTQQEASNLGFYHAAHVTFKDKSWKNGIKIYLVIEEDFDLGKELLKAEQRILIYQVGAINQKVFIEQIEGLVKEHWIYRFCGIDLSSNRIEEDLTAFWHLLNQKYLEVPQQPFLKTLINFHTSYWVNQYSIFNDEIYNENIVNQAFIEDLELEHTTISTLEISKIEEEITSFYYTNGGLIKIKIPQLTSFEDTYQMLLEMRKLLNPSRIYCQSIICQNENNDFVLSVYVKKLNLDHDETYYRFQYPTKLYYREYGEIKTLTAFNQIYQYINRNFIEEEY